MDEKGGDGIAMDDEPEADGTEKEETDIEGSRDNPETVADVPCKPTFQRAVSEKIAKHGKEKALPDSPRGRISIKEKLTEMRGKAYGQKVPNKPEISKGKEKSL